MLDPFNSVILDVFDHYEDIDKELNQTVHDGAGQFLIRIFTTQNI